MKNDKELLELLLEYTELWLEIEQTIKCSCLCSIIRTMSILKLINSDHRTFLPQYSDYFFTSFKKMLKKI